MKKVILFVFLLIALSSFVLADLTVSSPTLGDDNQDRGENISTTFTVRNNGPENLTDILITTDANSKYKIGFSNVPSSLDVNQTATITVYGYVPLDFDAVNTDGEKQSFNIGELVVRGDDNGDTISRTAYIFMEAENKLVIDELVVSVNGDDDSVDDGDNVKDIEPEDEIEVTIRVENRFDDRGRCSEDGTNCDFEDVEVDIDIDDNDWDVNEEIDLGDIDADEDSEESVTFDVDEDADGDYEMVVLMVERDENGALHGEKWVIDMEVEKKKHNIEIRDYVFYPSSLACDERDVRLEVKIKNTGRKDEDDVVVDVENDDFDILLSEPFIELDEGDSTIVEFNIELPDDAEPDTYYFDIIAFYDNDEETDRIYAASLTLDECPEEPNDEEPDEEEPDEELTGDEGKTQVNIIPPITGKVVDSDDTGAFQESKEYIVLLGVGVIIVLLLIVIEASILLRSE